PKPAVKVGSERDADPISEVRISPTAPICGAPEALRTYPEIAPGCSLAHTGSANPRTTTQVPSLYIKPYPPPGGFKQAATLPQILPTDQWSAWRCYRSLFYLSFLF